MENWRIIDQSRLHKIKFTIFPKYNFKWIHCDYYSTNLPKSKDLKQTKSLEKWMASKWMNKVKKKQNQQQINSNVNSLDQNETKCKSKICYLILRAVNFWWYFFGSWTTRKKLWRKKLDSLNIHTGKQDAILCLFLS